MTVGAVIRTLEVTAAVERLRALLESIPAIGRVVVATPAGGDDAHDRVTRMLGASAGVDHIVDCSDRLDCAGREGDIAAMIRFHVDGGYDATEPRGYLSQTMPRIVRRETLERIRAHSAQWPYYAHFAAVGAKVGAFGERGRAQADLERRFFEEFKSYRARDGHLMMRLIEFEYFAFPLQLVVNRPLARTTVLELGSGRLFGTALFFALAGARRVWALDADPGCRTTPEEERALFETLRDGPVAQHLCSLALDGRPLNVRASLERLFPRGVDARRLRWLCPATAEEIPLGGGSVDLCVSFSTLEHVRDLEQTAREVRRVLRPGGWAVHWIDLKDHERPDRPMEFLKAADAPWALEPVGAPNRARFGEHMDAFRRARFEVRALMPRGVEPVTARQRATLAPRFRRRGLDDLAVQLFGVVLRRR